MNNKRKNIIIIMILISIFISILLIIGQRVFKFKERLNKVSTNITSEKLAIEHYTRNLENIPRELTIAEAIKRDYFVYDCVEDKVYNEEFTIQAHTKDKKNW